MPDYTLQVRIVYADGSADIWQNVDVKTSDDLFDLTARLENMVECNNYVQDRNYKPHAAELRKCAKEHNHPNYPCAFDWDKRRWTCGYEQPAKVPANARR